MTEVYHYLPVRQMWEMQKISREFYDDLTPIIMRNKKMLPVIQKNLHIFIKDRKVYGIHLNPSVKTREVDFEEDPWRHDCQFVTDQKVKLLFKFEDLKLADDEELLPHYIVQLSG